MFRVLIADDVPKFREYMQNIMDWNAYGFEIIGEARNGAEAMELAASKRPHIALLDITMPLMDGITLAERLKAQNKDIHIALITGNGEFEYARKALKLGVEDYILKPFNKDELLSAMLKFKLMLQKTEEDKAQAKHDVFYLKERFLNTLITEEYEVIEAEIRQIFQRHQIELYSQFFAVATIEIDNMHQLWTKAGEITLWRFAVSNVLNDMLACRGTHLLFNGPEGRVVSVVNFKDEAEMKSFTTEPYQKLCEYVKKYFRFSVTVGMGRFTDHLNEIRMRYQEAIFALQHKLIAGSGSVIESRSLMDSNRDVGFYQIKLNDRIVTALRRNDIVEVRICLSQVKDYIKENKLFVDLTYSILTVLVSICLSYITEMGGNVDSIFGNNFNPYQEIMKNASLDEFFERLSEVFEKTVRSFTDQKRSRSQKIVDSVKDYIHEHYMDCELSMDKISQQFYLDSSYIRRVFSKELDMSVSEYITLFRMRQAKELFNHKNLRLTRLSEAVGYSDTRYFSKCFKKQYGVLPSEYRNQQDNEES